MLSPVVFLAKASTSGFADTVFTARGCTGEATTARRCSTAKPWLSNASLVYHGKISAQDACDKDIS